MTDFEELSLDMMEQVTGGKVRLINTGTEQNAAIRNAPGNGKIIASLPNGTRVDTIGSPIYDSGTDRNWIQIRFTTASGNVKVGWIAASILGLKRK